MKRRSDLTSPDIAGYHKSMASGHSLYGSLSYNPLTDESMPPVHHELRNFGAERLRDLMERSGHSAASLSEATGISAATLKRWKTGRRAIPKDPGLYERLISALGTGWQRSAVQGDLATARNSELKRERRDAAAGKTAELLRAVSDG